MTLPLGATGEKVDALRSKIRSLFPEPPAPDAVALFDGPDKARLLAPRAITIAEPFQEDQDGITEERVERGAGPTVTTMLTVAGSVYVGGGPTTKLEDHRAAASAILSAIDAGLRADRTLGGVVSAARLGSASWLQGRDEKGAGVAIGYTIELVIL